MINMKKCNLPFQVQVKKPWKGTQFHYDNYNLGGLIWTDIYKSTKSAIRRQGNIILRILFCLVFQAFLDRQRKRPFLCCGSARPSQHDRYLSPRDNSIFWQQQRENLCIHGVLKTSTDLFSCGWVSNLQRMRWKPCSTGEKETNKLHHL